MENSIRELRILSLINDFKENDSRILFMVNL